MNERRKVGTLGTLKGVQPLPFDPWETSHRYVMEVHVLGAQSMFSTELLSDKKCFSKISMSKFVLIFRDVF